MASRHASVNDFGQMRFWRGTLLRSQNAVKNLRPDVPLAAVMRDLHDAQAIEIEADCL
jgi:hypothetical protein